MFQCFSSRPQPTPPADKELFIIGESVRHHIFGGVTLTNLMYDDFIAERYPSISRDSWRDIVQFFNDPTNSFQSRDQRHHAVTSLLLGLAILVPLALASGGHMFGIFLGLILAYVGFTRSRDRSSCQAMYANRLIRNQLQEPILDPLGVEMYVATWEAASNDNSKMYKWGLVFGPKVVSSVIKGGRTAYERASSRVSLTPPAPMIEPRSVPQAAAGAPRTEAKHSSVNAQAPPVVYGVSPMHTYHVNSSYVASDATVPLRVNEHTSEAADLTDRRVASVETSESLSHVTPGSLYPRMNATGQPASAPHYTLQV
eukprot:GFYU01000086.1.p1 GENE.GFYU01000086.1~~GFYU01000086.1.p1  ORF type:complete len:359 (+),score=37.42 GFYU01000086.1:139-1077(+)